MCGFLAAFGGRRGYRLTPRRWAIQVARMSVKKLGRPRVTPAVPPTCRTRAVAFERRSCSLPLSITEADEETPGVELPVTRLYRLSVLIVAPIKFHFPRFPGVVGVCSCLWPATLQFSLFYFFLSSVHVSMTDLKYFFLFKFPQHSS